MISRLIQWLLYFSEKPGDRHYNNRRWRYWPQIGFYNGRFYIGWALELVQFAGKVYDEPTICSDWNIQFVYDPRKWRFGQEHLYYNGPHCFYEFGPIAFIEAWRWCEKCCPKED